MNSKTQILFRAAFLFLCVKMQAQTLTCQYNCPQPGEVFSVKTSSPVLHTAGQNQLWNYSQLSSVSAASSLSYTNPSSVTSSSLYPQANVVRVQSGIYTFLETGNAGVKLSTAFNASVNAQSVILPLPFSYGDSHSQTIVSTSLNGTDTMKAFTVIHLNGVGTGTLMLPGGGYYNDVLRISGTRTESTTKNGTPVGYIYTTQLNYYYSEKISHPLFYMEYTSTNGPADFAPYTQFVSTVPVGIMEESNEALSGIKVAPNPSTDKVNVTSLSNEKGKISLINSLGEVILQQQYLGETAELELRALANGMYTLLVTQGETTQSKKLLISR